MARFNVNQKVVANTTALGMTKGEQFQVVGVGVQSTVFGEFVVYELENVNGKRLAVSNGHLLLNQVYA